MGAGGSWVGCRGEQEARRIAPRRVCACRNMAQGSLKSCLHEVKEKTSKAAGKAAGNPADEEQPLMGLSWQVSGLGTGHLSSTSLCSLHAKGQLEN